MLNAPQSAVEALNLRVAWLRKWSIRSAVIGALLICGAWLILWPGMGFNQGFARLVLVPDGLSADGLISIRPNFLNIGNAQALTIALLLIISSYSVLVYKHFRSFKRIKSNFLDFYENASIKRIIIRPFFIAFSIYFGVWIFALIGYLLYKKISPNKYKNNHIETDTSNVNHNYIVTFILKAIGLAIFIFYIISAFALSTFPQPTPIGQSSSYWRVINPNPAGVSGLSPIIPNRQALIAAKLKSMKQAGLSKEEYDRRLEQILNDKIFRISPLELLDKLAFVKAQNDWLQGNRADMIASLKMMNGTWLPLESHARRRLGFMVNVAWADLTVAAQQHFSPLSYEISEADVLPRRRWGITVLGLLLVAWGGITGLAAARRGKILARFDEMMVARLCKESKSRFGGTERVHA